MVGRQATVSRGSGRLSLWGHREPLGAVGAGGNEAGASGAPRQGRRLAREAGGPARSLAVEAELVPVRGGLRAQSRSLGRSLSPQPWNPDSGASPSSSSCVRFAGIGAQTRTTGSERRDPPPECAEGAPLRVKAPSSQSFWDRPCAKSHHGLLITRRVIRASPPSRGTRILTCHMERGPRSSPTPEDKVRVAHRGHDVIGQCMECGVVRGLLGAEPGPRVPGEGWSCRRQGHRA